MGRPRLREVEEKGKNHDVGENRVENQGKNRDGNISNNKYTQSYVQPIISVHGLCWTLNHCSKGKFSAEFVFYLKGHLLTLTL